jgi:hypothetical protein
MRGIGVDFGQSPILDCRYNAASGDAHGAVGVKLLCGHGILFNVLYLALFASLREIFRLF